MTFSPLAEVSPVLKRRTELEPRPESDTPVSALYRRHGSWLLSALRRKFGRDAAEDLAQDVYLRLSSRPPEEDIHNPKAYLMTVAGHLAIDAARKRRRQMPSEPLASFDEWTTGEDSTQFEFIAVKEAILSMPAPLRDVFLMSRFGGMTYQTIAAELGISIKTVEWRMSRAFQHCSDRMKR